MNTEVDTVTLQGVISNINSVYSGLNQVMNEIKTNKSIISGFWEGNSALNVERQLDAVSQEIDKFNDRYNTFMTSLKNNASSYDNEEANILSAISKY